MSSSQKTPPPLCFAAQLLHWPPQHLPAGTGQSRPPATSTGKTAKTLPRRHFPGPRHSCSRHCLLLPFGQFSPGFLCCPMSIAFPAFPPAALSVPILCPPGRPGPATALVTAHRLTPHSSLLPRGWAQMRSPCVTHAFPLGCSAGTSQHTESSARGSFIPAMAQVFAIIQSGVLGIGLMPHHSPGHFPNPQSPHAQPLPLPPPLPPWSMPQSRQGCGDLNSFPAVTLCTSARGPRGCPTQNPSVAAICHSNRV